jgi:hypothetical protein
MAAGGSAKLREVSDIVEMLEQWELASSRNFNSWSASTQSGRAISVMFRGGEVDTVFGFEKEADALEWIKEKVLEHQPKRVEQQAKKRSLAISIWKHRSPHQRHRVERFAPAPKFLPAPPK